MGEKCSYVIEKTGTSFLGSPNSIDFAAFSHALENWWGNPCISHIIKYTIECESTWKKALILWENYDYQFPRFSTYDGFCRIFPEIDFSGFSHSISFPAFSHVLGNWRENPYISHIMMYRQDGNLMEKTTHFMEKVWEPISQAFPIRWVSLCYGKFDDKNPCISHVIKYTIGWESNGKKHPYCRKSMSTNFPGSPHTMGFLGYYQEPISQTFPIRWVWLLFPMLWEINEKTHAFPMWWSIP